MGLCSDHTETSQFICFANQLTGFYMIGTLVVKGLKIPLSSRDNRKENSFYLAEIHIFSTSLAHLASYHYCIFLEGVKVTQK